MEILALVGCVGGCVKPVEAGAGQHGADVVTLHRILFGMNGTVWNTTNYKELVNNKVTGCVHKRPRPCRNQSKSCSIQSKMGIPSAYDPSFCSSTLKIELLLKTVNKTCKHT